MEKINVAELLKDCPKGMELDCTMFNDVVFNTVEFGKTIIVTRTNGTDIHLDKYGTFSNGKDAKCVIFPKGKTTWEGFHRPFKDGDIVYIRDEYSDATFTYVAIFKQIENGGHIYSHCFYNYESAEFSTDDYLYDIYRIRFATEEEKQKLFQAIKDNRYKWNAETKTLEKLPMFKVGDKIRNLKTNKEHTITHIDNLSYYVDKSHFSIWISEQDEYELVPDKFDINTLVPFESRVLVRDYGYSLWQPSLWGLYDKEHMFPYITIGSRYRQCIPYEENEHLLGTTDDCDEFYKTWK